MNYCFSGFCYFYFVGVLVFSREFLRVDIGGIKLIEVMVSNLVCEFFLMVCFIGIFDWCFVEGYCREGCFNYFEVYLYEDFCVFC